MNAAEKQAFKDRAHYWAGILDVKVTRIALRPMRNKWASCSSNGQLSFNVELLELEQVWEQQRELWDYVIVHELLHFSVPNHGKLWKSLMRVHLGAYEAAEARLRQAT